MNRQIASIILMTTLISACATEVTSSLGRTVIVRAGFPDMGIESALLLANNECKKQGLSARVQGVTTPNTNRYIFECV